ncbi:hypothetical protein PPL_09232 [Heterostelium album PN500]|uniref:Uncharacterized protein n=1 Tax=Heterostelium pallidum (strain ATCC 26659 / Pp 5 / PN500) TaxID=670386 RepID=D3BL00_HETP5|nr:hypothetical protein PPL_09232 [Heterostelium album PN500]EFA78580.1 hypothetical protein PPL_09232 [Heterostelium album PN500]|eukprot:XP_020430704.1 hypothetical protein PPL_09232 [Heterostelium album PN500]
MVGWQTTISPKLVNSNNTIDTTYNNNNNNNTNNSISISEVTTPTHKRYSESIVIVKSNTSQNKSKQ